MHRSNAHAFAPPNPSAEMFIGLMSGTSLDGVDGVLAQLPAAPAPGEPALRVLAHSHAPMPSALRAELLALNQPGSNELHRAALAANALAELQAQVVAELLAQTGLAAQAVCAIGSHGQTVRHRPGEFDGVGYTVQLNQAALLAERCGIAVAADFRSRDVAAAGQGAPLVPAFHAMVFGHPTHRRAVLNLGGIGNLTLLAPSGQAGAGVLGFDCGPGNALMDAWIQRHQGRAFDAEGTWAAGGRVQPELLAALLAEPFLHTPPPKSTGRDLFNEAWLGTHLARQPGLAAQDVQATLAEFSAQAAAQALQRNAPATQELLVCGGGALNADLMQRLARALPGLPILSTAEVGLPPMQVEAAAFAWLASALLRRQPGNRPEVTGARGLRLLGALYPA
jgi:anhydro-N-acetylmuramic acid kinase